MANEFPAGQPTENTSMGKGGRAPNTRTDRILFGIREKLISVFIIIKVLPLIALALFAAQQIDLLGKTVRSKSAEMVDDTKNLVNQVGELATESSIRALDIKSRENIERLTTDTARRVADFLYERDLDIQLVAQMPVLEVEYRKFVEGRKKEVVYHRPWQLTKDGTRWEPAKEILVTAEVKAGRPDNSREFHYRPPETEGLIREQPLYHELTFIDTAGKERIKISATDLLPKELKDISKAENTWCAAETYFSEIGSLQDGEIYVSRVIGPYLPSPIIGEYTPSRAMKENIEFKPEEAGYAGKENPVGIRFQGIIRWVTPVFRSGVKLGYVSLALDHTHVMEFTDHLVPTEQRYSAISDAGAGNYAFMWDNKGRNISHPRDYFIVGFDPETGTQAVPWVSSELYDMLLESGSFSKFESIAPTFLDQTLEKRPSPELTRDGMLGLDCRYLNFAPQCSGWFNLTQYGGSGSFVIFWSNLWKLTTAAAIPYYTGQYGHSPRGFGFVTIGANVDEFHSAATETAGQIKDTTSKYEENLAEKKRDTLELIDGLMTKTVKNLTFSTAVMVVIVVLIAFWMAATITGKIISIIKGIQLFQKGDFGKRLEVNSKDELGQLAMTFNDMADSLKNSIDEIAAARDRAEESDKAKSIFLANMSHEIRTPMNAIIGMSRLALADSESEKQQKLLSAVKTSADSLLAVINDILDFSKIEAGQLDLEAHAFPLHDLVTSTMNSVSILVEDSEVEVHADIAGDVPQIVVGDQMRLRQILFNLLGNAVKFTKKGRVDLLVNSGPDTNGKANVVFEVRDTGVGIAPEHLELIFDSFSQSDVSISRKHQGAGLGLAISRKLCQLMGGDISVQSEVGKGSIFKFTLPFVAIKRKTSFMDIAREEISGDDVEPMKILLVEDNIANRELAQMVLEQDGHKMTMAESGLEALGLLASQDFDIVLMDVQMPEMDGFTATKIVRACEKGRSLDNNVPATIEEQLRIKLFGRHQPIVALTAHAMRGDKERCVDAGMDDYLTKPFQPENVSALLHKYAQAMKSGDKTSGKAEKTRDGAGASISLFERAKRNLCLAYSLSEDKVTTLLSSTIPVICETMEQLETAVAGKDYEGVRQYVHSLKGVLLNLRLSDEAKLAEQIQQLVDTGELTQVESLLEKLKLGLREFLDGR